MHLLDDSERDVDVREVLIAVLVHFLAETRVATPDIQDLECRLDILGDDILDPGVSLVPVKGFLISTRVSLHLESLTFDNGPPNTPAFRTVPFLFVFYEFELLFLLME